MVPILRFHWYTYHRSSESFAYQFSYILFILLFVQANPRFLADKSEGTSDEEDRTSFLQGIRPGDGSMKPLPPTGNSLQIRFFTHKDSSSSREGLPKPAKKLGFLAGYQFLPTNLSIDFRDQFSVESVNGFLPIWVFLCTNRSRVCLRERTSF